MCIYSIMCICVMVNCFKFLGIGTVSIRKILQAHPKVLKVISIYSILLIAPAAYSAVGGIGGLYEQYPNARPNTTLLGRNTSLFEQWANSTSPSNESIALVRQYGHCGEPSQYAFHLFRPASDEQLPWPGMIFALTINSIWYWCSDQVCIFNIIALLLSHMYCVYNAYEYEHIRVETFNYTWQESM